MASHTVQKVTLAYDEQEDRLRLAMQDANGQLLTLWLTQRLANRLARVLVDRLDSRLLAVASIEGRQADAHATIQGWEQAVAMAQFEHSAPVRSDVSALQGLIHSIDISERGDTTVLVFRWPADDTATLALEASHLRQWLAILYQDYGRAQWPTAEVWPAWMVDPATAVAQPSSGILH